MKLALLVLLFLPIALQQKYGVANVHSHNDYAQPVPFHNAFGLKCGSIEADVYLQNGELIVAHLPNEVKAGNTLKSLYLNPLLEKQKQRKLYDLQLLIDIKTASKPTIDTLVSQLSKFPKLFHKNSKIRVVISGNMPKPESFVNYPEWLFFDGRFNEKYDEVSLKKVALMSVSFGSIVKWDGKRALTDEEKTKITEYVSKAHQTGKKIRFWATPDTPTAWQELMKLNIDWIGTDNPSDLAKFLVMSDER